MVLAVVGRKIVKISVQVCLITLDEPLSYSKIHLSYSKCILTVWQAKQLSYHKLRTFGLLILFLMKVIILTTWGFLRNTVASLDRQFSSVFFKMNSLAPFPEILISETGVQEFEFEYMSESDSDNTVLCLLCVLFNNMV